MALYNRHRPDNFKDIVGNVSAVQSLQALMSKKIRPHVYLFTGPSGCGKTTLGWIIANHVGATVQGIEEIDCAQNPGVDTARDIKRNMRLAPLSGEAKVYLLDECHRLTGNAQDALLKPLEDVPEHVYFILCTTIPEKLKKTIRTRCTTVAVKALDKRELRTILSNACDKEEIDMPRSVLGKIAEKAEGSARTALVMLEQVMHMPEDEMEDGVAGLVAMDQAETIELCRLLLKQAKWAQVADTLAKLKDTEEEAIRRMVLGYANAIMLKERNDKLLARAFLLADCFRSPFYDSGRAGLAVACYEVLNG